MSRARTVRIRVFGAVVAALVCAGLIAEFGLGHGLIWIAGCAVFVALCLLVLVPRGRNGPRQHDVGRGWQSGH